MAKKVKIIGTKPKRVSVVDNPKRRIEPAEMAAALGAEPNGNYLGANVDPISLAELGTQLLNRLRSTGGRPALDDATEFCRVPLSAEDLKSLEAITDQIVQNTGTKPSPGQLVSVIVRQYLQDRAADNNETGAIIQQAALKEAASAEMLRKRLADIADQAGALQKAASEIEAAAKELHQ